MTAKSRMLLVDDEKRFAQSLQGMLRHHNYDCDIAYTGKQAITCLRQSDFDIVLLDVELPDISGCDIAKYISKEFENITVVMLTGIHTVDTAVQAMKNGAYDFLKKPVETEVLLRTLAKAHERSVLKKNLLLSEKRFRILAESSWEGVVIFDDQYSLIEGNRQFYKMFQYQAADFPAKDFLRKIFPGSLYAAIHSSLNESGTTSFEVTGVCSDGSKKYIEARISTTDYMGKPAKVMTMHDISVRIQHEKEKIALEKKLAKASKLNALGLMAGSVAHDLNNILTAVVSYPDLLMLQMDEKEKYYSEIQEIHRAGKRAAAIVSDLVTFARGGVRKKTVSDFNTIIQDYLDSIEHGERLKAYPNAVVQISLQKNLHNMECSPVHMRKVLLNLVGNALESVGDDGILTIQTRNCTISQSISNDLFVLPPGEYVQLTVSDNGSGIDSEKIDHIFDPFYTTKETGKGGTGLGLTIIWNIVQEHRGWIEVEPLNPGVAFIIYLPSTEHALPVEESSASYDSLKGNNEKILVVDDQPEQNMVVAGILNKLGYRNHSVTSGEEAVSYLQKNSADLVILDMMMGNGLNGRQTYEKILDLHPDQKAVVLSGYCDAEEVERTKSLGINVFIQKPISVEILGKEIQGVLARH